MIKVTIEVDEAGGYTKSEITQNDGVTLSDLLDVVNQAIKGAGFIPPSNDLGYEESEEE